MRFMKKHPYLFGQITGFLIIIVDFLILFIFTFLDDTLFNDTAILFVLLFFWSGLLIIVLSPIYISIRGKDERRRYYNEVIIEKHHSKYGKKSLIITGSFSIALCILTIVILNPGNPIFDTYDILFIFVIPFAVVMSTIPFIIYYSTVKKKYYRIRKAEKLCKIVDISSLSALDDFYKTETAIFFGEFDKLFFRFIYNYYNSFGILKKPEICFYRLNYAMLNSKYGFNFSDANDVLLCLPREENFLPNKYFFRIPRFSDSFNRFIDNYKELQKFCEREVFVCRHIIEDNEPILYVFHSSDNTYQFLCGEIHKAEDLITVPLNNIFAKYPWMFILIKDLPIGYTAERKTEKSEWEYFQEGKRIDYK